MAKRDTGTKRTNDTTTTNASDKRAADTMEQRLVAFAEQFGRMVGTIQAKTEGLMDREMLIKQITSVRDSAADLLDQLASGATKASNKKPAALAAARGENKGRSGGVVDAPGKKHRKPMPTDRGATIAGSQAAKMRTAMTMVKTNRRRGRG